MTAPLLEREGAQALLVAEAARAHAGTGRLVLLRGATGTGRTAALERATAQAAALGLRVLSVRCSPEDRAAPFSSVRHLLCGIPEFTDSEPSGTGERDTAARLWRTLYTYAEQAPLCVAVDDVHLADPLSHRWFTEAARRVDALPLLLLATERSQYDIAPHPAGLTHTLPPSLVRTLTLHPLGEAAATRLVRDELPSATPQFIADCVRAGAGSPLLLRALLEDLREAPGTRLPESSAALYPGAYPAAVSWWLDSAGKETAEVARALAGIELAAIPADLADPAVLLAAASGTDPARVTGWLTAMTRLGPLRPDDRGRPRWAHPLLRDAVLAGWPAERRLAAGRAAAGEMLRRGDPVEAVARQLLAVTALGEPWALRTLRDAAAVAVREARPADAVRYLRRALDEPLPDALRQRLLTELGSLEYSGSTAPGGIPRLTEALRLPAGSQDRVRTALALGTALADRGEVQPAVRLLHRVAGGLAGHPELARTVQAAVALLSDQDQTVRAEAYRALSDTADRSPSLVGTAGAALLVRYAATAGTSSAREAMGRIRELLTGPADPLAEPFLLGTAAAVAQWADELDEAEALVERGLDGQRPGYLHPMAAALRNVRLDVTAARGDHQRILAEHAARSGPDPHGSESAGPGPESASHGPELPWRGAESARRGSEYVQRGPESAQHGPESARRGSEYVQRGPDNADAHAVLALVATGRLGRARRLVDSRLLREAVESWELNRFLYARGVLRSAEGDLPGALHDFLESGRRQSARTVHSPVVTPWRSAAAACQLALGNRPEALALATEELRLARVWDTPRTVGRALRALGRATGGPEGLQLTTEAVELLRSAPDGNELAAALLDLGIQLLAGGDRPRARAALREAAAHAERLGALHLRTQAADALRETGARRAPSPHTGADSLTAGERRVADLAAQGRTNTEIAELLGLARRTVETHLTSTYRKLGVRGRGELGVGLKGEDIPT
ncbi:LuxR family transcriptional regulator [Streptomyces physcomitrii]|uniref:helix-turn-helix transcriptional regulator n=1 Tax=Streptomyces physcomitrii TaxID=2724184 RepID=UPI0033C85413